MGIEQIQGGRELLAALSALPPKLAKGLMKRAAVAAAKVVRIAVQSKAPVRTGTLKRAVVARSSARLSTLTSAGVVISVTQGKWSKKKGKRSAVKADAYYARWVEFGHKIVARGKSKKGMTGLQKYGRKQNLAMRRKSSSKFVAPQPFMAPAFASSWQDALRAFESKARADFASGKFA